MSGSEARLGITIEREGPCKITRPKIDAVWKARDKNKRLVVGDSECRGLALVVNPTSMAWRYDYKPRGVNPITGKRFASRSVGLGNPASLSPDEARAAANKLKGEARAGGDPAAQKKAKLAEEARKRAATLNRLLELYGEALPKRQKLRGGSGKMAGRTVAEELGHAKATVVAMNVLEKSPEVIVSGDINRMLAALVDKPATARHRFGALSRFFDWAQDEGHVTSNPCAQVTKARRPKPSKPRPNFHTPKQLGQLWRAIDAAEGLHHVQRDIQHFLMVVPCRRGEAAGMDWSDLDLAEGVWSQFGTPTKNGDPHRVHLPTLALEILKRRHQAAGSPSAGLVFPAPRSGKKLNTFGKAKKAINAALDQKLDWRIHDHRRSFVTALAESGAHEAVLDAILNHRQSATRGGVLGVYQRAQRWPEQVQALDRWNDLIAKQIIDCGRCT